MKVGEFVEKYVQVVQFSTERKFLETYKDEEIICYVAAGGEHSHWSRKYITGFVFKSARKYVGYVNGHRTQLKDVLELIENINVVKKDSGTEQVRRIATMEAI